MPKKPSEEKETKRYLLLRGTHIENERDEDGNLVRSDEYDAATGNNIVESKRDLVTLFGANTFRLISDDKTEMKVGPELEKDEEFTRLSSEERAKAGQDAVNKVTEEEVDSKKKFPYREDRGIEQAPPEEEQKNPDDQRKKDLDLPAKRTSAERTTSRDKNKEETKD